jgi:hypothetical protein
VDTDHCLGRLANDLIDSAVVEAVEPSAQPRKVLPFQQRHRMTQPKGQSPELPISYIFLKDGGDIEITVDFNDQVIVPVAEAPYLAFQLLCENYSGVHPVEFRNWCEEHAVKHHTNMPPAPKKEKDFSQEDRETEMQIETLRELANERRAKQGLPPIEYSPPMARRRK